MPSRLLQCRFTLPGVEFWSKALEANWEEQFSPEALRAGRKLYKSEAVCAWDLTPQAFIIHQSLPDRNKVSGLYTVIEWVSGSFKTRSSSPEDLVGESLAVAGLYELEEWLVDQYPNGIALTDKKPLPEQILDLKSTKISEEKKVHEIPFLLETHLAGNSCRIVPFWDYKDRKQKIVENKMTREERGSWIRLAALARRAGFTYDSQASHYKFDFEKLSEAQVAIHQFVKIVSKNERFQHSLTMRQLLLGPQILELKTLLNSEGNHVQVRPTLFLDGQPLAVEKARRLIREGGDVIFEDVGWVQLSPSQLEFLKDWQIFFENNWEQVWPTYMLFSIFVRGNAAHFNHQVVEWRENFDKIHELLAENSYHDFLRSYQVQGVDWMCRLLGAGGHPLLADEMGLGKTLQVLEVLHRLQENALPSLIVAPASVLSVWEKEVNSFYPKTKVLRWKPTFSDEIKRNAILLISYTQLRRYREVITQEHFKAVVLDEAQFIKNPQAKTSQAIFALKSQYRLALSGTPIENRVTDLWSIFRFLMPGLLGGQKMFERFMASHKSNALLRQQLKPFILRRLKQDVLQDLPAKVEVILPTPLTDFQKTVYKKFVSGIHEDWGAEFPDAEKSLHFLTTLLRLRQISCDASLVNPDFQEQDSSGKINILLYRVKELLESGEKVVIFSQFVQLLEKVENILTQELTGFNIYKLLGSTPQDSRGGLVREFQETLNPAIFLGSLKAAGTGITLHSASYVFLLDPWWNPSVEAQAIDRLHRFGQKKTVFVYRLVAPGTIEARVQELQQQKKELFDNLISDLPILEHIKEHFKSLNNLIDFKEEGE